MRVLHRGGSLVVFLSLLSCADLTALCPSNADPQYPVNLIQSPGLRVESNAGSLEPLYNFARLFLEAVQPNKFPIDIVLRALRNGELNVSELVRYEAGYLVCLILAVLYLVLMPIVVGVLACLYFRNCKNVALNNQAVSAAWHHRDTIVTTCLSVVTILLLAGVILTFTTTNKVRQNTRSSLHHLESNIGDIDKALNSIPKKLEIIVDQYSIPQTEMAKELNGTEGVIGATIISAFKTQVNNALSDMSLSVQDATGARHNLEVVQETRENLQTRHTTLQSGLQDLQNKLKNISNQCPGCDLDRSNLETDASYDQIPSVDSKLQQLSQVSSLRNVVEQGNSSFHSIPEMCTSQTAPKIADIVLDLEVTKELFENSSQMFPSLQSLSKAVSELHSTFRRYNRDIDHYDYIRWAVSVVFCTLILVIVVLMVAALALGLPMVISPTIYPIHREDQLRLTAVYLLRAAVSLTLLFSWLFIIIVFITLFFGGNAHTLVCRSWIRGEIFEFLDKKNDLFSSMNITQSSNTTQASSSNQNSQNGELKIRTAAIYHGCQMGQSMYNTMYMHKLFDMEQFLNASKYLEGFNQRVQDLSVNLSNMTLLSYGGRRALTNFKSSDLDKINYPVFLQLLSRPVVKRNLTAFAYELDVAAQLQEDEGIKEELRTAASLARNLSLIAEHQKSDAKRMNTSVKELQIISKNYKVNVDNVLKSTRQTEEALLLQVPHIVGNVSECLLDRGEELLHQYFSWVRHAIIYEVLDCQWLSVSLHNVYTAFCQNIVDPWNAFWLCLGWCCAFLVPGVIFSVYTARLLQPLPIPVSMVNLGFPEKDMETAKPNIYMTLYEVKDSKSFDEPSEKGCEEACEKGCGEACEKGM